MGLVYFDNAATTRNKPKEVLDAFNYYIQEIGTSPGRGSYQLGIQASRMLYQSRKAVAQFFGNHNSTNVIFSKNSTEAINLFFNGYLHNGDHVIISPYEHNAVLRPIHNLSLTRGITYSVIEPQDLYNLDCSVLDKYIKSSTRMVALTLASNLTGQLVFRRQMAEFFHEKGIEVFVDASQGGGKHRLNMDEDSIDALAFTGHKDLFGLPGVGGLCTKQELKIIPLIQGGTGVLGDSFVNPEVYPEAYESGTLNMPAIWALKAGIEYLIQHGKLMKKQEETLLQRLIVGMKSIDSLIIYNLDYEREPTLCFNVQGRQSSEVVALLDKEGICTRAGIHCAILAHRAIGTEAIGAVRVSLNSFNTESEVNFMLNVLDGIR
jgi:cysteine desulfurase / selenocysteine lyase